jgi:hypothetical protein
VRRLQHSPSARVNHSLSSMSKDPNLPSDLDGAFESVLYWDADSDWDCSYDGGVNHEVSENEAEAWIDDDDDANIPLTDVYQKLWRVSWTDSRTLCTHARSA